MGTLVTQDPFRQDHAAHIRHIAGEKFDDLGDTSTLADPDVVDTLIEERKGIAANA
jgi:hypothetical protein